jgi:hypothetical protein
MADRREIRPAAVSTRPPGLSAQQPTGRLPKRPARLTRLGQKPAQLAVGRSRPSIHAGDDPTAIRGIRWNQRPAGR